MARFRSLLGFALLGTLAACSGGGGGGNPPPPPAQHTLSVTVSGSGGGTVTSSPAGISCSGGTCTASYAQDTHVTLTATPAGDGSTFGGWGGGACAGLTPTCQVILGGEVSVTATFTPPSGVTHTLSVTVAGSGSGSVSSSPPGISCTSGTCSATFAENVNVTLTATAAGGGSFVGWSGFCFGAGTTCTLTMSGDRATTATFAPPVVTHTLSVTLTGNASGTVSSSPPGISCSSGTCSATFEENTNVTLTATASGAGAAFAGWSGACDGSGTGTCTLTMSGDRAATAAFSTSQTLAVTVIGDGVGTVTSEPAGISCTSGSASGCTASFPTGTHVRLTATPNASSSFIGWTPTCDAAPTPCEFDLGSGFSINANFSAWLVHRPFPNVLRSATLLGATMIAVGDGGAWLTSTDGKSWTGHEAASLPPLRGIATDGNTAVAVGDGTAGQGTILTTTDGETWTPRTSNTAHELFGIVYASGTFVAVGKGGAIVTSSDGGATWTARTSNTTRDLLAVAWGNGTFVATGYAGTILTSPDGQSWTARTSNTTQFLSGVAWRQYRFVAVGSGGAVCTSSDDGATWSAYVYDPGAPPTFVGLAADADRFVAVDSALRVLTSSDGAGWSGPTRHPYADPGSSVARLGSSFYVLGAYGGIVRSGDGFATLEYVMPATGYMPQQTGAAYGGGTYVVVGSHGAIFSSPDGATWTARRAAPNEQVSSVAYGNGAFVAVATVQPDIGAGYAAFLRSTDGITWTPTGTSSAQWGIARYGGGTFLAMTTNNTDTFFATSPDGATWTAQPTLAGKILSSSLAHGASTFVATSMYGDIFSNPDPASGGGWIPESSPTSHFLSSVTYGSGTFVAIDRSTSHDVYTSPDGQTWTPHYSNSPLNDIIAFGNGVFRSGTQTSTDGITWTDSRIPLIRGEDSGFASGLATATYGGPAGWVAAKSIWIVVFQSSSMAFLTHP